MIIQAHNNRFGQEMYTDSRLVNKQGAYCLCTQCARTSIQEGETAVCSRHDTFIEATTRLRVAAPIFACPEFQPRPNERDYILAAIKREQAESRTLSAKWILGKAIEILEGQQDR